MREFVRFILTGVEAPLIAIVAQLIPLTEQQLTEAESAFNRAAT